MTGNFRCLECKKEIETTAGAIIVQCVNCGAVYYIEEEKGMSLQISGASTFPEAKLDANRIMTAIQEWRDRQREDREKFKEQFEDKGLPFDLICLSCGEHYEAYFNDQPCPYCNDNGEKRWMLKQGFEKEVPNPAACTIKDMRVNLTLEL